ncbi:MAG: glutathione peroxidase [Flavobacteriales bacterium]|jgi:glutathione peroxidase|tara:strand:+ start:1323 stop:1874 length:552 start_codon:yes stop_codon:yes gene_type:complete
MKNLILILTVLSSQFGLTQSFKQMKESIHQFEVTDLTGQKFNMSSLKGNKIMVVNTASKCGLTYQYEILEKMYKEYKSENFIIVGFPSNNFLWQEPGSNEQIAKFCLENYGVSFPMMEKISVRGSSIHPLYKFLTDKKKNGYKNSSVKWNFQKYLIDEDGYLVKIISPKTKPDDSSVIDWIKS